MRRMNYTMLLQGRRLLWLVLIFMTTLWLTSVFYGAENLQGLPNSYAYSIALLTVMATAAVVKPEQKTLLEYEMVLPQSLWRLFLERLLVSWGIIFVVFVVFLRLIFYSYGIVLNVSWYYVLVGYIAIILLFGAITLWGTVWWCDSQMGLILFNLG